jgi:Predicted membrane protein
MSKFVTNRIDLGQRVAGFTCYESATKEFLELTPKQVKNLIAGEGIHGLKLEKNEIALDQEGFNMKNLMVKSGIGNFHAMNPVDSMVNTMYSVVKVILSKEGKTYEIVSNKAARTLISEERLKVMMEFTSIAGVVLDGSKAIQVCSGVEFEDTTPKEESKPKIEVKQVDVAPQAEVKQVESALPKNEPKGKDVKK